MTVRNAIKQKKVSLRSLKVNKRYVNAYRKSLASGEYELTSQSLIVSEINCVYKDRGGVYIFFLNGRSVKVGHSVDELMEILK